jgi:hypothetical protein
MAGNSYGHNGIPDVWEQRLEQNLQKKSATAMGNRLRPGRRDLDTMAPTRQSAFLFWPYFFESGGIGKEIMMAEVEADSVQASALLE